MHYQICNRTTKGHIVNLPLRAALRVTILYSYSYKESDLSQNQKDQLVKAIAYGFSLMTDR